MDIETLKSVRTRLLRKAKRLRDKRVADGIEDTVKNIIDPMIKQAIENRRLPDPEA